MEWKDCQISPCKRGNQNFGILKRIVSGIYLVLPNNFIVTLKFLLSNFPDETEGGDPAEEKKEREHLLALNQVIARQVMEKSRMVAGIYFN